MTNFNYRSIVFSSFVVVALALAGCTSSAPSASNTNEEQSSQPVATANAAMDNTPASQAAGSYKNGTYTSIGKYTSPAGEEEIDVSVTLTDGKITAATVEPKATNQISQKMQGNFKAGFSEQVVGKSINEVTLTVVNGSSLTPKGFTTALEDIKTQSSM